MMGMGLRGGESRNRAALLVGLVIGVVAGAAAPAADDDVVADGAEPGAGNQQPQLLDLGMNFDANLFEQQGNGWVIRSGGSDAAVQVESPALARGRDIGLKRLERVESCCGLTAEQRQRLLLAVESDVRRFAVSIEETRAKYAGRRVNMNEPAGQKEWHAFQQDLLVCRGRLRNLFDGGSLFAAVLASMLDEGQRNRLAEENSARRRFHWRAMVLELITKLDATLGLDQRQHAALVEELLAREPALRIDSESLARDDPNLRRNLVLMIMAGGDARRIRETVSERQWRALSQLMNQGRAMRSWIEQQGVLEGKP